MKMIKEKLWEEFRDAGLFWFVNRFLHLFGWALVYETDDDEEDKSIITGVYPARCKFRGFTTEIETKGFQNLTKHLDENMKDLLKDCQD